MDISYDKESDKVTIVCSSEEYTRLKLAIIHYEKKLTYGRNYYHKNREARKEHRNKKKQQQEEQQDNSCKKEEKKKKPYVHELLKPMKEFTLLDS